MTTSSRKRSNLSPDEVLDIVSRLKIYPFGEKHIRAIKEKDTMWVPLIDVLNALDYKAKPSHVAKRLRAGEVELKEIGAKSSLVNCVNRAGLYSFALYSNDAQAMSFYRWAKKTIWGR